MQFEPMGGFPPIVRVEDAQNSQKDETNLGTRGFASTDIVSINSIMSSKKKGNLFITFGEEQEDGLGLGLDLDLDSELSDDILHEKPIDFQGINYREIPKRMAKGVKSKKNFKKFKN